jgi:hypothetical protein
LHELIAPEQTPPAARLFIGRWTNSDAQSLSEFNSELAYFARPNGRDLVAALHERSAANPALPPAALAVPIAPAIVRQPEPRKIEVQRPPGQENRLAVWLRAHRRQVIAGTASAAAFMAAGLTVAIWPSSAAGRSQSVEGAIATGVEETVENDAGAKGKTPAAATTGRTTRTRSTQSASPIRPGFEPAIPLEASSSAPQTGDSVLTAPAVAAPGMPAPIAPAQGIPDTRVYTAADSDVEPPVLQSPEIPEWLITGFDVRKNSVELLIAETGEVLKAKMLAAPQRLPDVMLLSRVKEWAFTPATRGGVPVRYRMVLSWSVTP